MKQLFILVSLSFFLTTCKKFNTSTTTTTPTNTTTNTDMYGEAVPVADFTTSKAEYEAGETMVLISTCTKANSIRWTLPDGTTAKTGTVSYPLESSTANTYVYIGLEAISSSGLKSDYIAKKIKINPGKATLTVYSNYYSQAGSVFITIDGTPLNSATFNTPNAPTSCSQNGYSTYIVTAGTHTIQYTGNDTVRGTFVQSKVFTISTGACLILNCN